MTAAWDLANVEELGWGRSGVVYRVDRDALSLAADSHPAPCHPPVAADASSATRLSGSSESADQDLAIKVFFDAGLASVVHLICSGAGNPYAWCEPAIRCAVLRRQILSVLAAHWFDDQLQVAEAYDCSYLADRRAYAMSTRFVSGRPAALHHPFSEPREGEAEHLAKELMPALQGKLIESGFDGLAWQAGKGNPVALNNFLLQRDGDTITWHWIDLESGVPALFPINPLLLLSFYLPRSFRHGRAMLDDVHLPTLRQYLDASKDDLVGALGESKVEQLRAWTDELDEQQRAWKAISRPVRSVTSHLKAGKIDQPQADYYVARPLRWYGRLIARGLLKLPGKLLGAVGKVAKWVAGLPIGRALVGVGKMLVSQAYRTELAQALVRRRIDEWRNRGQLTESEASFLHWHLTREDASDYITDFGMHVAIKPIFKSLAYFVILPLTLAGAIPALIGWTLFVSSGLIGRTFYTLYRLCSAATTGHEKPWAALLVGMFPVVGNAAYPLQIMYSGTAHDGKLAQFIVYDAVTKVGQWLPIWGGADTWTEHRFNRLGDLVARDRDRVEQYWAGDVLKELEGDAPPHALAAQRGSDDATASAGG